MSLIKRQYAFSRTVAKFQGPAFAWGKVDCLRLFAAHARHMGHGVSLVKAGNYSSLIGATRALARSGFPTLPEGVDAAGFLRIPPAAAVIGDAVALPGEGGLHALQVVAGNGRVFGFHEDAEGADFIQPHWASGDEIIAWRIEPRFEMPPAARTLDVAAETAHG